MRLRVLVAEDEEIARKHVLLALEGEGYVAEGTADGADAAAKIADSHYDVLIAVDVRFIAATNRDIERAIAEGRFRHDLYCRLAVFDLSVPPLRERSGDIEPLARHFLAKHCTGMRKDIRGFAEESMDILLHYAYPGNVRELANIVERAVILEEGPLITPAVLPRPIMAFRIDALEPENTRPMNAIARDYARAVVDMLGGNKAEASRQLGISRTSLWRMLRSD